MNTYTNISHGYQEPIQLITTKKQPLNETISHYLAYFHIFKKKFKNIYYFNVLLQYFSR